MTRKRLVAHLRETGEAASAAEVAKLPRPTPVVWAINQAAHKDRPAVERLLAAADELKRAQLGRGSTGVVPLAKAYQGAVAALTERSLASFRETGRATTAAFRGRVTGTLMAASTDPKLRKLLQAGQLQREAATVGFDVFGDARPALRVVRRSAPAGAPTPARCPVAAGGGQGRAAEASRVSNAGRDRAHRRGGGGVPGQGARARGGRAPPRRRRSSRALAGGATRSRERSCRACARPGSTPGRGEVRQASLGRSAGAVPRGPSSPRPENTALDVRPCPSRSRARGLDEAAQEPDPAGSRPLAPHHPLSPREYGISRGPSGRARHGIGPPIHGRRSASGFRVAPGTVRVPGRSPCDDLAGHPPLRAVANYPRVVLLLAPGSARRRRCAPPPSEGRALTA